MWLFFLFLILIFCFFHYKINGKSNKNDFIFKYDKKEGYYDYYQSDYTRFNKQHFKESYNPDLSLSIEYKRKDFMTERERGFYDSVSRVIGIGYYVIAQVRLVDIIEPNISKNNFYSKYMSLFRRVSQYHIDFVIVRRLDHFVVCAIELDDSSHLQEKRIKRDKIVNKALSDANIYFIRSTDRKYLLSLIKERFF